jgi:uncharacterized membrane protein YciS (DUF1049 family)
MIVSFLIGVAIGLAIGWLLHAGLLIWRDIQQGRVDRIKIAAGDGAVKEMKVRRER